MRSFRTVHRSRGRQTQPAAPLQFRPRRDGILPTLAGRPAWLCLVLLFWLVRSFAWCAPPSFQPIAGFSSRTNGRIEELLSATSQHRGRKVAVFDGDGTVLGQSPHYLADECLYREARRHPEKRPDIVRAMRAWSNVSIPYVKHRVFFFEGDTVDSVRDLGDLCFRKFYGGKVFTPMKQLIRVLQDNGFEAWIVSASPEAMYQKFLSRELGIPMVRIIGVRSVTRDGRMTSTIVEPVPQDDGKKAAIETFIQEQPLLVAGNSRGDREMIEYSSQVRMIINPDQDVAPGQKESLSAYARRNGWIIERIRDVPEPGFPSVSSRVYGVRQNRAHDGAGTGRH